MPINLDPTVKRNWQEIRKYWRQVRGPCARCGEAIHYDEPRYAQVITKGGRLKRIENPWALDIGHKLTRDRTRVGQRVSYPTGLIAPEDTQPEHARCNRRAGAIYGNNKHNVEPVINTNVKTSREW